MMKVEDKLKLARNKQNSQQTIVVGDKEAVRLYSKDRKEDMEQITKAIEDLAKTMDVKVELPEIKPLLDKLETLNELPDSFADIKNMSVAISTKMERILEFFNQKRKPEFRVQGFRNLMEMILDRTEQRDADLINKFADLQEYLNQLNEVLKQGQRPEEYKPVRLVIGGDGVPLKFLQAIPSSRGGGGSSGGGGEVTQGTTPWVVNEQLGATTSISQVGDSASSVTLLSANTSRIKAVITNDSSAVLYVKEGTTASATSYTYRLDQYDMVIIDDYSGRVDGIWASDAGGNAYVSETV